MWEIFRSSHKPQSRWFDYVLQSESVIKYGEKEVVRTYRNIDFGLAHTIRNWMTSRRLVWCDCGGQNHILNLGNISKALTLRAETYVESQDTIVPYRIRYSSSFDVVSNCAARIPGSKLGSLDLGPSYSCGLSSVSPGRWFPAPENAPQSSRCRCLIFHC